MSKRHASKRRPLRFSISLSADELATIKARACGPVMSWARALLVGQAARNGLDPPLPAPPLEPAPAPAPATDQHASPGGGRYR